MAGINQNLNPIDNWWDENATDISKFPDYISLTVNRSAQNYIDHGKWPLKINRALSVPCQNMSKCLYRQVESTKKIRENN